MRHMMIEKSQSARMNSLELCTLSFLGLYRFSSRMGTIVIPTSNNKSSNMPYLDSLELTYRTVSPRILLKFIIVRHTMDSVMVSSFHLPS